MIPRGFWIYHDIDLNSDGTVDFVFQAGTQFDIYSTIRNRSVAIPEGGLDLGSFSIPLAEGFEISSLLPSPSSWQSSFQPGFPPDYWVGQTLHAANDIGTLGYWQPNMTAFLGVEFQIEGNVHYGWIRLSTLNVPGVNGGTIHDWAYNSMPGQPILAGQVPEPSTWALLVGGSFAFFALRRRKRPNLFAPGGSAFLQRGTSPQPRTLLLARRPEYLAQETVSERRLKV
jgi:hypothetical protein